MRRIGICLAMLPICLAMALAAAAEQQGPSAEELARANNPLADVSAFNLQNYYVPELQGLPDQTANTMWLRGIVSLGRTLIRASLPLSTVPAGEGGSLSGVGDLNAFAAYIAVQGAVNFGLGPLLVAPTADKDELGAGKWQLGAALVTFVAKSPAVQYGGLVTWQTSVAGEDDRPDTSLLATQWFGIWQLGKGTYLRSTPVWVFDLKTGNYNVPFGLGIGKVVKPGGDGPVFNLFMEPQFTVLHEGPGQPMLQWFTGINMQF
jgi:hypothetical protein